MFRKAEIGFKPATRRQRRSLLALLDASREVYNAALQERRDAYAHGSRTKVALFDQFNQVTDLRGVRDDVLAWGIQPVRWSLRRVDEAFGAFFTRATSGVTGKAVGYPRFKGHGRWNTVGYDETTGWKLNLDGTKKDPRPHLYVQGVGNLPLSKPAARQLRRYVARGGVPTTLTLTRTNREGSAWRASVGFKNLTVERMSEPTLGSESVAGADRGVAVLVAAVSAEGYAADPGQLLHHARKLEERLDDIRTEIEELQRQRDGKKKYGRAWRSLSYAGRRTWAVNPTYTSQQCSACGVIDAAARVSRETYYCGPCGHYEHADVNAARNIRARGLAAEQAWRATGALLLARPKPRLRRRKNDATPRAETLAA